jgi:hypothetical protein
MAKGNECKYCGERAYVGALCEEHYHEEFQKNKRYMAGLNLA